MNRRFAALVLMGGALVVGGCVSDHPLPAGPSRAEIVVKFSRDPLSSSQNGGPDAGQYPRLVQFELIVSETRGVGASMINQTLVTTPDTGGVKAMGSSPSSTIPAGGSLTIPMTLYFPQFPAGGITIALTVNAIDVAGNIVNGIGTVRVN